MGHKQPSALDSDQDRPSKAQREHPHGRNTAVESAEKGCKSPAQITPAAKLQADLREHFKGQSFGPGNAWLDLLPRLYEALDELDTRQQDGPAFRAVPRLKLGKEE